MVHIKVVVRIRPFSKREISQNDDIIVRRQGRAVFVTDPKARERQNGDSRQKIHKFVVDCCFDPNDCGTQEAVYREIGLEVLNFMLEGYNACVLAYGHSASGKTYTMMGVENDEGLTPRICRGLFEKINRDPLRSLRFKIFVSFLEIYNEKVRDLLAGDESGMLATNFSLRVREHPKLGPYVQDLTRHLITEKKKLLECLKIGNGRRITTATENNIYSSRSHAVFTIHFQQREEENFEILKSSKVHLVDLAGSERANSTQTKMRLKEGANINKSLVTLGNVISALAESNEAPLFLKGRGISRAWQPFVPYRDSILTWLLKDTLGGNSNTIMIAAVSPASSCFNETINTLRYAKRTKKIVNQPILNEDPKSRTIRELREEIIRLKNLLTSFQRVRQNPCEMHHSLTLGENSERVKEEEKNVEEDFRKTNFPAGFPCAASYACVTGCEKKSDVNSLVIDGLSHETRFFPNSLEKISRPSLKVANSDEVKNVDFLRKKVKKIGSVQNLYTPDTITKSGISSKKKWNRFSEEEFNSCENLSEKNMLQENRPDLINGITTRSRELPSANSQSCTDTSSTSRSTSENSINLSTAADIQNASDSWSVAPQRKAKAIEKIQENHKKYCWKTTPKEKNKRSLIVDAVTDRLFNSKVKSDRQKETCKAAEKAYALAVEEQQLKICKGAKMKLFDLGRKFAISRKLKKTADIDTQTDFPKATVRVKEKSVATDRNETSAFIKSHAELDDDQIFPGKNNQCSVLNEARVAKCSDFKNLLENFDEQSKAIAVAHKNPTEASTEKSIAGSDESFSDDSLESVKNSTSPQEIGMEFLPAKAKSRSEARLNYEFAPTNRNFEFHSRSYDSLAELQKKQNTPTLLHILGSGESFKKASSSKLISFIPFKIELPENRILTTSSKSEDPNESVFDKEKTEEPSSSDNCFTSLESIDAVSFDETSSEEFFFYEGNEEKEDENLGQAPGDRHLYVITENSEQSENGDALSPSKTKGSLNEELNRHDPKEEPCRKTEEITEETIPELCIKSKLNSREECNLCKQRNGSEVNQTKQNFFSLAVRASPHVDDQSLGLQSLGYLPKDPKKAANVTGETLSAANNGTHTIDSTKTYLIEGDDADKQNNSLRCTSQKNCYWKDFQSSHQKQFLNFNILNSSKSSPFFINTQLFGEPRKKDQSSEAMSASQDSITFIFMGPAKPKTSVLLEIIRKSLNRSFSQHEVSSINRKEANKEIKSDLNLMRSVSVDTAMMALSRLAKNQHPLRQFPKTLSCDALTRDEENQAANEEREGFQESDSQSCFDHYEPFDGSYEYFPESTSSKTKSETQNESQTVVKDAEKPKKSVSWSGKTKSKDFEEYTGELNEPQNFKKTFSFKSKSSNCSKLHHSGSFAKTSSELVELKEDINPEAKFPPHLFSPVQNFHSGSYERHVRFSSTKNDLPRLRCSSKRKNDTTNMFYSFKEGTQASTNYNSSNYFPVGNKSDRFDSQLFVEQNEAKKELDEFLKKSDLIASNREVFSKDTSLEVAKLHLANSTWPRRRSNHGKPPSGNRPGASLRHPRWASPSRSHPPYCSCTWNQSKNSSFYNLMKSSSGEWNLAGLSIPSAISNISSVLEENRNRIHGIGSRFPSQYHEQEILENFPSFISAASRNKNYYIQSNQFSFVDAEKNLKESCRRLESAIERDRIRQETSETKNGNITFRELSGDTVSAVYSFSSKSRSDEKIPRQASPKSLKRTNIACCFDNCSCKIQERRLNSCRSLCLKTSHSTFELDSFGPGSNHCFHFCMFCQIKNSETYHSNPILNSECPFGRCRLNFYGYCPCSSIRLLHVAPSPRAYMHHLLKMRRHIVRKMLLQPISKSQ